MILSETPKIEIINGDCLDVLKTFNDNSIDCVITDPPAGIGFMGKEWDDFGKGLSARDKFIGWLEIIAKECLRIMKPGAHALVWALPKTSHWTATAWENAGFEVRDRIIYCFGSGFPKSLNIANQIAKREGAKREGAQRKGAGTTGNTFSSALKNEYQEYILTENAKQWEGWGTALKPSVEDWWLLRKPLEKGLSIAENVLKWGTGGLNIDACRVGNEKHIIIGGGALTKSGEKTFLPKRQINEERTGRFPSHLIIDDSEEVKSMFPYTRGAGNKRIVEKNTGKSSMFGIGANYTNPNYHKNRGGSASRFFYCAKASRKEREMGVENLHNEKYTAGLYSQSPVCKTCNKTLNGINDHSKCSGEIYYREMPTKKIGNNHPTIKPVALMEYLVKLICPPNGIVLDPFMGSGSTGIACVNLSKNFIGIEIDKGYFEIAKKRIEYVLKNKNLELFKETL